MDMTVDETNHMKSANGITVQKFYRERKEKVGSG